MTGQIKRDDAEKMLQEVAYRYARTICKLSDYDRGFIDGLNHARRHLKFVPEAELAQLTFNFEE